MRSRINSKSCKISVCDVSTSKNSYQHRCCILALLGNLLPLKRHVHPPFGNSLITRHCKLDGTSSVGFKSMHNPTFLWLNDSNNVTFYYEIGLLLEVYFHRTMHNLPSNLNDGGEIFDPPEPTGRMLKLRSCGGNAFKRMQLNIVSTSKSESFRTTDIL